jgi:hypothetical protein
MRNRKKSLVDGPIHSLIHEPPSREKLKQDIETALTVARRSTASVGKFDNQLPNEKPMKVKRKVQEGTALSADRV